MVRTPASTKALEVKLNNQETELVALLKKLPIEQEQLTLAREKARQIRDGNLRYAISTLYIKTKLHSNIENITVEFNSIQNVL